MRGPAAKIRLAEPRDLPLLAELERDAAQLFRTIGYDYCVDGPTRTLNECESALRDGAVFVAEAADGALVGFVLVLPVDGSAHILEIGVVRAAQCQGGGGRLLAAAETWARTKGFPELTLTTYRNVPWNAPYYRRLGFVDFIPEEWRAELQRLQAAELSSGFGRWPRIAMRKEIRRGW